MKLKSKIVSVATSVALAVSLCGFGAGTALAAGIVEGAQTGEVPAELPFTVSLEGQELPVTSVVTGGYEDMNTGAVVDVYVVAVPSLKCAVDLQFDEERLVYNYDSGDNWIRPSYDTETLMQGMTATTVSVDAALEDWEGNVVGPSDGEADFVRVQNIFAVDSSAGADIWTGGELLYAITFQVDGAMYQSLTQKITLSTTGKEFKASKVAKKERSLSVEVSGAATKLKYERGPKAKAAKLKVAVNEGTVTVTVPKGTKAGTYKVKVWAKAGQLHKKSSNVKTITIRVLK